MPDHPPDIFASTAWYYARYRPPYPDAFARHIVARFGLDGTGRLLDLGCGTGQLALSLAARVAEAVGLDPEPEMLAEAAAAAARAGVANARWLLGADRDLPRLAAEIAPVRLATLGRSFHWMDQDATLAALDRLVEPDGGVVIVSDTEPIMHGAEDWAAAARAVIARWIGPRRRAGSGLYRTQHDPFEEILARSCFSRTETFELSYRRAIALDDLVGYLYSTSYCSPAVLGDARAGFEADLRHTLLAVDPAGVYPADGTLGAWLAWRA